MIEDPYKVLGCGVDTHLDTIRAAYRKLAQKHHPDKEGGSAEEFQRVTAAYELLSDPERRELYDRTGKDKEQMSVEQDFANLLHAALEDVPDPVTQSLTAAARRIVSQTIQKIDGEIKQAEAKLARIRVAAKRLKRKKGDNDGAEMLLHMASKMEEGVAKGRGILEHHQKVRSMVDEYDYELSGFGQAPGTVRLTWRTGE